MCTGIYNPKWFLQCFIDQVRPPKDTCSLTLGRAELSPTLQTSQAQPQGPKVDSQPRDTLEKPRGFLEKVLGDGCLCLSSLREVQISLGCG